MKHIVTILTAVGLLASVATVTADHHEVKLIDELKPMEWLIGSWVSEGKTADGDSWMANLTFKPALNGRTLELSVTVQGETTVTTQYTYYYDASRKTIAAFNVTSNGGHGTGIVWATSGKTIGKWNGVSATTGNLGSVTRIRERINADTYRFQQVDGLAGGVLGEDGTPRNFKRVK